MKIILFEKVDDRIEDSFIDFTNIDKIFIKFIVIVYMNGISTI